MKTNITASKALEIAKGYKEKYKIGGVMHDDVDQSVTFYSSICGVKGFAWVVVADISSYNFEGSNEFTFVISDETAEVEYVMDQNGISMDIHLNENRKFKK